MACTAMLLFLLLTFCKFSSTAGQLVDLLNAHRLKSIPPLVEVTVTNRKRTVNPFEDEKWGKMSLSYTASGDKEEAFKKVVDKFLEFAENKNQVPVYTRKVAVDGEYDKGTKINFTCTDGKMDRGGHGEILFCVTDEDTPREVVIKVMLEKHMETETGRYKLLKDNPAVPTFIAKGVVRGYKIDNNEYYDDQWEYHGKHGIVIEKYGRSVSSLHDFCNLKFSRATTLALAIEMFKAYKSFGDKEFVHTDVKPENMLYSNHLKVIDFESSALHGDEVLSLQGTSYYMSRNLHNFERHKVFLTDDLEGMDSVIALFWHGILPWYKQALKIDDLYKKVMALYKDSVLIDPLKKEEATLLKRQLREEDAELKRQKHEMGPNLFSEVPGLNAFTKYIYKIDPATTPNYTDIETNINDAIKSYGASLPTEMDWIRRPKMLFEGKDILTVNIIHEIVEGKNKFSVEFEPYYNLILNALKSKYSTVEISNELKVDENRENSGRVLRSNAIPLAKIAKLTSCFNLTSLRSMSYQHIYVKFDYTYNEEKEYLVSMAIKGCLEMWNEDSPLTKAINDIRLSQMTTDKINELQTPEGKVGCTVQEVDVTVEDTTVVDVAAFNAALAKITPSTHNKLLDDISEGVFKLWGYRWRLETGNKFVVTFIFEK